VHIEGKPIKISKHALEQANERKITFPDQVYSVLNQGKVTRFGKRFLKWTKRNKDGAIICIGEDKGMYIVIITIERKK